MYAIKGSGEATKRDLCKILNYKTKYAKCMFQSLFILVCIKKNSVDSISDGELKLSDKVLTHSLLKCLIE